MKLSYSNGLYTLYPELMIELKDCVRLKVSSIGRLFPKLADIKSGCDDEHRLGRSSKGSDPLFDPQRLHERSNPDASWLDMFKSV